MTPKEKADELFDKYYSVKWHNGKKVCSMSKQAAKDCALIAVDEIINTHLLSEKDIFGIHPVDYWQEVKQEIEKL
jgi:hypothetical protein